MKMNENDINFITAAGGVDSLKMQIRNPGIKKLVNWQHIKYYKGL